jgi:methylated-DNA-[protein]-cysteine S-methyltransferase
MEYYNKVESPVGVLTISSDGENITGLWIEGQKYFCRTLEKDASQKDLDIFENAKIWLECYFSGNKPDFNLPLEPKGSAFQKDIWDILIKIPYGETITYGKIAEKYKSQKNGKNVSARAVGGAVGRNPISIIIPCHRVIGSNGSLTGYAGGINNKKMLLEYEGVSIKREKVV